MQGDVRIDVFAHIKAGGGMDGFRLRSESAATPSRSTSNLTTQTFGTGPTFGSTERCRIRSAASSVVCSRSHV